MSDELAIDVKGMTKRFGEHTVVNGIDLQVRYGEIYGFLGPNGSGKTTFIRMLCGLLKADAGSGHCLGYDVVRESAAIKRQVGYMTQRFSYYEDLSIQENLEFVAQVYEMPDRKKVVEESLARLGLLSRRKQLTGELSGGWKQRLALAASLIHNPKLLLLDEPTAGVDPKARRDFWEQIHELAAEGLTFLITTHYMDEAERCHRLAYLSYGNILATGSSNEVVAQAQLTTYKVEGHDLGALSKRMRTAGLRAIAFGNQLHISGSNAETLERAITPFRTGEYRWQKINAGLEDVFIHLMDQSKDNYE